MKKIEYSVEDITLAKKYIPNIFIGSAFAFVNEKADEKTENELTKESAKYDYIDASSDVSTYASTDANSDVSSDVSSYKKSIISLFPDGLTLPGFSIQPKLDSFQAKPIIVSDKEIYRDAEDTIYLLLVTPKWSSINSQTSVKLTIENNGLTYRNQIVKLATKGLTIVKLTDLPEGNYRVCINEEEGECSFKVVQYSLSPFNVQLKEFKLENNKLNCRLSIEQYQKAFNKPVKVELVSGNKSIGVNAVNPTNPGIYQSEFELKKEVTKRLELKVTHKDLSASVLIPGSRKVERNETTICSLTKEFNVSLMPHSQAKVVRGLYVRDNGSINNSPVAILDIAPENRKAELSWRTNCQQAKLLILDLAGNLLQEMNLGEKSLGETTEIDVIPPACVVIVGAWIDEKAWEGWSILLASDKEGLTIDTPENLSPGEEVTIKLKYTYPAAIYLSVKDSRLMGNYPETRIAASLKAEFAGIKNWATEGLVKKTLFEIDPSLKRNKPKNYDTSLAKSMLRSPSYFPLERSLLRKDNDEVDLFIEEFDSFDMIDEATSEFEYANIADIFGAEEVIDTEELRSESTNPEYIPNKRIRRDFADVVYCDVVETDENGETSVSITLPDTITTYTIEAFAIDENHQEWCSKKTTLLASKPLWGELKLPPYIYPTDESIGVIYIGCVNKQFKLKLYCDEQAIPYKVSGKQQSNPDVIHGSLVKVEFIAKPGKWRAEVEDNISGEIDISEQIISSLGSFKSIARRFQLLKEGEKINRAEIEALQLRVLPSIDKPFHLLCDATTNYKHLCCEQTAAKVISAIASLIAGGDSDKLTPVIIAGIERQMSMYLPNKGFAMYPGQTNPNQYWGRMAAEYLLNLTTITDSFIDQNNLQLKDSLIDILTIAQETAQIYQLSLTPETIKTGQEAYRSIKVNQGEESSAITYARKSLETLANSPNNQRGNVLNRQEKAYCAATLLVGNNPSDMDLIIATANELANSLDENGRLYSTVDSVAMIALMSELKAKNITSETAKVKINNQKVDIETERENIETIEVISGCAIAEVTYEITEDWNKFSFNIPVKAEFLPQHRSFTLTPTYQPGDTFELTVTLREYQPGLLLHVCLPPCLSYLRGGGEVKRFSVDFAGEKQLKIPLQVTQSTLPQGEHWALLVRNMFKEEDAGNPGLLKFQTR